MKSKFLKTLVSLAVLLGPETIVRACLITDPSDMDSPSVIDFSQFDGLGYNYTSGPVQIGAPIGLDVTFTSDNPYGSVLGSGPYSLNDNGDWGAPFDYAGLDTDPGTMTFWFNSGPMMAVGGFMNYPVLAGSGFSDVIISALDINNNVLESYDINTAAPISTPGGYDDGAFRGIMQPTADIAAFSVSNSAAVITDLTFSDSTSTASPEPGTFFAAGAGAVLLFALRRRIG